MGLWSWAVFCTGPWVRGPSWTLRPSPAGLQASCPHLRQLPGFQEQRIATVSATKAFMQHLCACALLQGNPRGLCLAKLVLHRHLHSRRKGKGHTWPPWSLLCLWVWKPVGSCKKLTGSLIARAPGTLSLRRQPVATQVVSKGPAGSLVK